MTVCAKQSDTVSIKAINRNSSGNIGRPSFMITDILAVAADKKNQEQLLQLNKNCANIVKDIAPLNDAYEIPSHLNLSQSALNRKDGDRIPHDKHDYYDSDADGFCGYDDADNSSVCSNGEYKIKKKNYCTLSIKK